jgi:hypothetical protein
MDSFFDYKLGIRLKSDFGSPSFFFALPKKESKNARKKNPSARHFLS